MSSPHQLIYPERKLWEPLNSPEERMAMGKKQRAFTPREAHATMAPGQGRLDTIQLLIDSGQGRVEKLIPIRYGRMLS